MSRWRSFCVPTLLSAFTLLFIGCAETRIYEHGQLVFRTHADVTNFSYRSERLSVQAESVVHSTPTLAGGQASAQIIGATANLAGVIATGVVAAAGHPVAAAVIPAGATVSGHINSARLSEQTNQTLEHEKDRSTRSRRRAVWLRQQ